MLVDSFYVSDILSQFDMKKMKAWNESIKYKKRGDLMPERSFLSGKSL